MLYRPPRRTVKIRLRRLATASDEKRGLAGVFHEFHFEPIWMQKVQASSWLIVRLQMRSHVCGGDSLPEVIQIVHDNAEVVDRHPPLVAHESVGF